MRTPRPRTFLFGDQIIATAAAGRGRYGHTFGGPHDRKGASRDDCDGIHIHLLHRFDLTDPAVPFSVPGVRWLPFYYCFDFRANSLGYRLVSDDGMVTYFPTDDPNVSTAEEWPHKDYPAEFPKSSITITGFDYDPTDIEHADMWAGVFGIGRLSKQDQATLKKRVAKQAEEFGLHVPETAADFRAAMCGPFMQGRPDDPCLNPKCVNRTKRGRLTPIALMPAEPVKGVQTYGEWSRGVRLIFMKCDRCHTIRVTNEST